MSESAQNSRGRTAPRPENPQNAEQWNQMLEHIRQHYEAQISQLVETVRSYGLAIARNPDGTFTVNVDDDANPSSGHANCHRMPCSLLCGITNGLSVLRPMNQPISRPSQSNMPQKFRRPQRSAADRTNSPQLQRFDKPQQIDLNQQLNMGQFAPKHQCDPSLHSGKAHFSTSQLLQFNTPQQCGPGSQFGNGRFSTSQPQQFGKPKWFSQDLQTNRSQFKVPQPPQFRSFQEFCMSQQASSFLQAPRSREGRLPSASSQGPLAPVIPQASCLQHPFGSPLTTPRSQPLLHWPCSSSLSHNQHELSPYEPCPPQSFGSPAYASGPSHVMTNGESYEHALSPQNDQTVSHHTGVLSTMVPFTEASFVAGSSNLNASIDPPSRKNIDSLLTQAISPYPSQVPKELDATRSPDPHDIGCIKMALARGSTAGLNVSQHHKPATPNDSKKISGISDNVRKEPLRRHKHFHNFEMPLSEVFNYLVKQGLLQPMKNYQPRNPNAILNTTKHCAFHRYHGHATDKCNPLKKVIRRLIERGKIKLPIGQDAMNHPGFDVTEFKDSSIVNEKKYGPPLVDVNGLIPEVSHQATLEPPSTCSSCTDWGSCESQANDNFEEISSISTDHGIMRPQD